MKINLNKLLVILLLLVGLKESSFAQAPPSVSVPTACPNQTVTATVFWANVSTPSYSLYSPPFAPNAIPSQIFSSGTFPMFAGATGNFTIVGIGQYLGAPITQVTVFSFSVSAPPPMALSTTADNCQGSTIVINAPVGGNIYYYTGANVNGIQNTNSNIISIAPATISGTIGVTTAVSGCTMSGVVNVAVAPLKQLNINPAINICQGSAANFTASLTGSTPGTFFQWYNNNNIGVSSTPAHSIPSANITHAGVWKVTVDDPFNNTITCPYTATTSLNVVQTNPVNLTASPSTTVCQGNVLNLSANAAGASSTGWVWTGPSFNSNIANPVVSPAQPGNSGVYSVTATFNGQFITCNTSNTISVFVIPVAVPVITMPASVCQGDNFVISGVAGSATNGNNFQWSGPAFPGGATTGTSVNVSNVQPNASGTQYLTVKFISGAIQCPVTSSVQLNVVTVNTVSVVPPDPICSPNNAFLQSLATGANQYAWSGPLGFSGSGANVYVYYPTPAASGIYSVTAFFNSGNLVCTSSNTLQLTVTPALNFSLVPFQRTCYSEPLSVTGPAGATSYSWTSSTGFSSGDKDLNFNSIQPNNSGTYTLTVMLGGCKSFAVTEISVLSRIDFSLTPFDRTLCSGDTTVFEVGATGGSENYAYTWNPDIYLESKTGPKHTSVPLGSVLYNVTVVDIACPNTFFRSHTFSVTVNNAPVPDLHLVRTEGCAPFRQTYDIGQEARNGSFINTYDFGNGLVFQKDTIFDTTLVAPGTYNLKIYTKGMNGCSGVYEYPNPLVVFPGTGIDVIWSPEIPTTTDEITFYPNTSYTNITSYNWQFNAGIVPGDTNGVTGPGDTDTTDIKNPVRVYNQFGTYPVVLIAQNDKGCIDTLVKYMPVIDDMQIFIPNSFTPNDDGVNDVFMAKGMGLKPENYVMDIFSRAGVNVFTTKDINQGWDGKVGGQFVKDATYIYKIKVVGMNGEGRKEFTGYITIIK